MVRVIGYFLLSLISVGVGADMAAPPPSFDYITEDINESGGGSGPGPAVPVPAVPGPAGPGPAVPGPGNSTLSPPIPHATSFGTNSTGTGNSLNPEQITIDIINCTEERECKAACGSRTSASKCSIENGHGICQCWNEHGPPVRCRNVFRDELDCVTICDCKVAQICRTDFGLFCSCFARY